MKALILAAGMGTRLGKYTNNLPKGMLLFNGKPLIEWQIRQLRNIGIEYIYIVTGYKKEKILYPDITYFHNPNFASTNMVESMLCAREILNSEILITYSDIIFTQNLARKVSDFKGEIGVAVDKSWKNYWMLRYGTTEIDLESISMEKGKITELGKPVTSSIGIDYRYIGMIKFSEIGIKYALKIYDQKKIKNENWLQSGNAFQFGYMTDLLNEIIGTKHSINPIISDGDWLEFDTVDDYELNLKLLKNGKVNNDFFD